MAGTPINLALFGIPLSPPETFTISLAGVTYTLRVQYRNAPGGGGWYLDIGDSQGNPLVQGIAMVTGCDLLGQYAYLGIGGGLVLTSGKTPDEPATFDNLGSDVGLYFLVPTPAS